MLVLSRKADEGIVFPDLNIRIVVVEVRNGSVKLGIEAERKHTVLREELTKTSTGANTAAAQTEVVRVDLLAESPSNVS